MNRQDDISDDDDMDMKVDMELDDGRTVTCDVITTFESEGKTYIALQPLDDDGENTDGSVWIYRFSENKKDKESDPEITYIASEAEYKKAGEAFEHFLDSHDHNEIVDDEQ